MDTKFSFWPLCEKLKSGRFVDLTHPLEPSIPHLETSTVMRVEEVATYQANGHAMQQYQFEGQWGTHADAPSFFIEGGRTIEQIALEEMILPLVVINISDKVAQNPDYILLVDDVLSWEDEHGSIPMGAFVALRTDWSKRWPDSNAMLNYDDRKVPHTPGWSLDALSYLYGDCEITASGQETMNPDAAFRAQDTNWMCKRYILAHDHYQIGFLCNLDQCPPKGALVVCSFPKPRNAPCFPARVFAICPPE